MDINEDIFEVYSSMFDVDKLTLKQRNIRFSDAIMELCKFSIDFRYLYRIVDKKENFTQYLRNLIYEDYKKNHRDLTNPFKEEELKKRKRRKTKK